MVYLLVNSEPSTANNYQVSTDTFINTNRHDLICNDYRLSNWPSLTTYTDNALVRLQFQPSSQRPVFAVINCVSNSPTHDPYELLINEGHYGDLEFDQDIARWRLLIDSVHPPPPPPTLENPIRLENGTVRFTLRGSRFKKYRTEASVNLFNWVVFATNLTVNTNGLIVADTNAPSLQQRFYRAAEE